MMNEVDDKEDHVALAGEYVIGTLDAEQQQAVKNSLESNPVLNYWVHYWEDKLPPLYADLPEQQPARGVWKKIKQHIKQTPPIIYSWQKTPWWQNVTLWRGLTLASMVSVVSLMVLLRLDMLAPTPVFSAPNYIAVVRDDKTQALWHINIDPSTQHLFVTTLQIKSLPDNQSYELWLLPKDKQMPPRSIGIMPREGLQKLPLALSQAVLKAHYSNNLAISLEPLNGSPLAVPSGPIAFQAKLDQVI